MKHSVRIVRACRRAASTSKAGRGVVRALQYLVARCWKTTSRTKQASQRKSLRNLSGDSVAPQTSHRVDLRG